MCIRDSIKKAYDIIEKCDRGIWSEQEIDAYQQKAIEKLLVHAQKSVPAYFLFENGTDEVQFVLVFKLSRFGRNAADVLNSLQRMQDFGVNLICVEDGIDSSKDSGKLMISVLSAMAEIERENILVQTMEGRKQKACLLYTSRCV